jgi:hypothetical protein
LGTTKFISIVQKAVDLVYPEVDYTIRTYWFTHEIQTSSPCIALNISFPRPTIVSIENSQVSVEMQLVWLKNTSRFVTTM